MSEAAGPNAKAFLKACGYPSSLVDTARQTDRLVHDLGIDGDNLDDDLRVLRDKFNVEMHGFDFSLYSPSEFSRPLRLLDLITPGRSQRLLEKYRPITLAMIEDSINAGRWVDE